MGNIISAILAFLIACVLVWVLKGDLKEQAKTVRNELGRKALLWTVLTIGTLVIVLIIAMNATVTIPAPPKEQDTYYDEPQTYDNPYDCEKDTNGVWIEDGRYCIREPLPNETQEEDKTQEAEPQETEPRTRTLEAGEYVVGKDIAAGRYKATPTGQGGDFFVRSSSGLPIVNTTLSSAIGGDKYAIFSCSRGYKIKTQEAVKITPVEEEE